MMRYIIFIFGISLIAGVVFNLITPLFKRTKKEYVKTFEELDTYFNADKNKDEPENTKKKESKKKK